jgi:hypothetical protein
VFWVLELFERFGVEADRDDGAAAVAVGEGDRAEMLLDDLLDDREAEPGAAAAGGHIGLDDAVALDRQPDAVVGDGQQDAVLVIGRS